ncbi:MAG: transcriptional regulator NrdR [Coxiellaceae bacterium]|nr:transcriptional regulator NrdR [Coxiellaceae bacterium]|tara:strand:- start:6893 stop:7354 length:462 start_codon:yes stop_codon:yes gene_type:complete
MYCPFCHHKETKVVDSRLFDGGVKVRRRRQCLVCGERFTTHESIEISMPRVVKNDNSQCSFDESKIRSGIIKALEKRPVSIETVDAAVNHVVMRMRDLGERVITTQQIGEAVMGQLRDIDQVAYVRFASVYRSFEDIQAFDQAIQTLKGDPHE